MDTQLDMHNRVTGSSSLSNEMLMGLLKGEQDMKPKKRS